MIASKVLTNFRYYFILLLFILFGCNKVLETKPNVIVILTDDQGWGDLSLHGNPYLETPNMDGIALNGARLNYFYVSPVCAPTRAELLTGKIHLRTGTTWVTHRKEVMRSGETTIAEVFKENGYHTSLFGKWHNGEQYPNNPQGQGFDRFYGFTAGHWNNYFDGRLQDQDREVPFLGFITDVLTDKAIEYTSSKKNEPFFCMISYNAPHSPFQVPDAYFDKFKALGLGDKDACVYGMIENLDANIGRFLMHLDKSGLSENSIVVFLTDNGPNGDRYNGALRGRKGQVYEGGVRVPCFIKWPKMIKAGTEINHPMAGIDLLPSLTGLCGMALNSNDLDGVDFSSAILGKPNKAESRYIYSFHTEGKDRPWPSACRDDKYALVRTGETDFELYNLTTDPGQTLDIQDQFPKIFNAMSKSLKEQFNSVSADKSIFIAPPIPLGFSGSTIVELPAPEAELKANVKFKGHFGWANDWLVNWTKGSTALWPISLNQQTDYQIDLLYNCKLAEDGFVRFVLKLDNSPIDSFKINESSWSACVESPDRVVRGEVYEKRWGSLPLGRYSFNQDISSLSLEFIESSNLDSLEIKSLILKKRNL